MEQDRTSHVLSHHENWRGRPLISHEVIVNLIANTTTKTGLTIRAELDTGSYPTGIQVERRRTGRPEVEAC